MLICTDKGDYVVAEKVVAVSVQKGNKPEQYNVVLHISGDIGIILTTCKKEKDAELIRFNFAHLIDYGKDENRMTIGKNQYNRKGFKEACDAIRDNQIIRSALA